MATEVTCVVVTPEATAFEKTAAFVSVPMYDGELGVLPGRAPMIGRLGQGELRLRHANGTLERFYVQGGFVQVVGDTVSLLTGGVTPVADLDVEVVRKRLDDAKTLPANTTEQLDARLQEMAKARTQLRLVGKQ